MESTVTMPLEQYDRMKEEHSYLGDLLTKERKSFQEIIEIYQEESERLSNENKNFKHHTMKNALLESEIEDLEDALTEYKYRNGILHGFHDFYCSEFKQLNITLDDQREYIKEKHAEYQAQKQQEELQNGGK